MNINSEDEINKQRNQPLLRCWEDYYTFNFQSAKIICKTQLYIWMRLPWNIASIKIIIILWAVISPSLLYQILGNFTLNLISSDSSFFSTLYKHLFLLLSCWWHPRLFLFIFGSSDKLYISAEFSISLCTEDCMLNATETAVCYFVF